MTERGRWNWEPGKKIVADVAVLPGQYSEVHEFAASPDGEKIAVPVVREPGQVAVWVNGETWESEFERA